MSFGLNVLNNSDALIKRQNGNIEANNNIKRLVIIITFIASKSRGAKRKVRPTQKINTNK